MPRRFAATEGAPGARIQVAWNPLKHNLIAVGLERANNKESSLLVWDVNTKTIRCTPCLLGCDARPDRLRHSVLYPLCFDIGTGCKNLKRTPSADCLFCLPPASVQLG